MKAGLIRLMVIGMMVAGVSVAVADQAATPTPAAKDSAAKAKPVSGVLSAPAKDAAAGVLAVLTHKGKETTKTYTLTAADADVVAKIKDLVAKGASVKVTGEVSKDGTSIAVTKITAEEAKK